MRHTLILIYLLCLSPLAALASYDKPPIPGDWQLSFSDDFDHLDTEKWNTSLPLGRVRLGGSICFFLDENVTTANGDLIISSNQGKHELTSIKGQRFQRDYHSGQINSFGKFTQQYGYFEARMKLPQSAGLWPAFWLMPNRVVPKAWSTFNIKGTKGMEIDIMEHLSEWGPNSFHYAAHWDGYKKTRQSMGARYAISHDAPGGYRKFGLYWQEGLLIWFIDDIEVERWSNPRIANIPMHMIISTEMGGWATDDFGELPDHTYVDYVRVWTGEAQLNPIQEYKIDSAQVAGKWKHKKNYLISKKSWFRRNKDQSLRWNPYIKEAGHYKLYAKWPHLDKELNSKTKFMIGHAHGMSSVMIDQNKDSNYWLPLGDYDLKQGQLESQYIKVETSTKERVVMKAVRYELLD